jgi:hypothetical protein
MNERSLLERANPDTVYDFVGLVIRLVVVFVVSCGFFALETLVEGDRMGDRFSIQGKAGWSRGAALSGTFDSAPVETQREELSHVCQNIVHEESTDAETDLTKLVPGLLTDTDALLEVGLVGSYVAEVALAKIMLSLQATLGDTANLGRLLLVVVGGRGPCVTTVAFHRRDTTITNTAGLGARGGVVGGVGFDAAHGDLVISRKVEGWLVEGWLVEGWRRQEMQSLLVHRGRWMP